MYASSGPTFQIYKAILALGTPSYLFPRLRRDRRRNCCSVFTMAGFPTDPSSGSDKKLETSTDLERNNAREPVPYTGLVDEKEFGHVRRGLKARHVQFIAIGGIIGTGLFVGSGAALVRAGPLSILLAYTIVGTVIYSLMLAIGEVCSGFPHLARSLPLPLSLECFFF